MNDHEDVNNFGHRFVAFMSENSKRPELKGIKLEKLAACVLGQIGFQMRLDPQELVDAIDAGYLMAKNLSEMN